MTKLTTGERLIVIEEQLAQNAREHGELKDTLAKIDNKLDCAITEKADKTAVDALYKGIWSVVLIGISAFVGLITWLIQRN